MGLDQQEIRELEGIISAAITGSQPVKGPGAGPTEMAAYITDSFLERIRSRDTVAEIRPDGKEIPATPAESLTLTQLYCLYFPNQARHGVALYDSGRKGTDDLGE